MNEKTPEEALRVGRPPGTSPGWTVWHRPSGLQAITAVRYKKNAEEARGELLATGIAWEREKPVPLGSPEHGLYEAVYRKYGLLRQAQLSGSPYWPRPREADG